MSDTVVPVLSLAAAPKVGATGPGMSNDQDTQREDDQALLDTHGMTWREYVNEAYSTPVNQRMSQWDYQGRQQAHESQMER